MIEYDFRIRFGGDVDFALPRSTICVRGSHPPIDGRILMKYLCLIYGDEKLWEAMSKAEADAEMAEYMEFTDDIRAAGQYVAGEALQPVATATTVRIRDGKVTT